MNAKSLLLLLPMLTACVVIREPVSYGAYHIDNQTLNVLTIRAFEMFNYPAEVPLLQNEIQPNSEEKIYVAIEGSGGHVMPSNFFGGFEVYMTKGSTDTLVYEGVNNADWENKGFDADTLQYYLTISL